MANALYDYINYYLLNLIGQLKQGKLIVTHSPTVNALLQGIQLAASTADSFNQKYVSAFNSILYIIKEETTMEHPVISISKKSKKVNIPTAASLVDKDNNPLTEDHLLKGWMEAEVTVPESVSTYLTMIKAEQEEKDRIDREKRATQILKHKPIANIIKSPPPPMPPIQTVATEPVDPKTSIPMLKLFSKKKAESDVMESTSPPQLVPVIPAVIAPLKILTDWEMQCINILKKISKHDYIDTTRDKCICNFYTPVLVLNPNLVDYAKIVKHPMDLSTLGEMVDTGGFRNSAGELIPPLKDPLDFYRKLISVFGNTVLYNEGQMESTYAIQLVKRCKHLIRYCKWLCLEKFQLDENTTNSLSGPNTAIVPDIAELDDYGTKSLVLSVAARDKHRSFRINSYVKKYGQASKDQKVISDCRTLLKDLERLCTKTTQDRKVYSWFNV